MILFIWYCRKGKTIWLEKKSVFLGTGAEEEVDYTGAQENFGSMGQFYILIIVVFTWLYTFIKNSQNWIQERVNFITCKIYLNTNWVMGDGSVVITCHFEAANQISQSYYLPDHQDHRFRDHPQPPSSPLREVLIKGIGTVPCINQRDHLPLSRGQLWVGRWVGLNQLDILSWAVTKGLRMVVGEFCCVNGSSMWLDGPVLRPWHSYCSQECPCFLLLIIPIPILLTMARISFCCL